MGVLPEFASLGKCFFFKKAAQLYDNQTRMDSPTEHSERVQQLTTQNKENDSEIKRLFNKLFQNAEANTRNPSLTIIIHGFEE